ALAAYPVFYSRQARSYALLMLLALIFILRSRTLLSTPRRRPDPAIMVVGALLCLTHHLSGLLLATGLLLAVIVSFRMPGRIPTLITFLVPVALCGAVLVVSRAQLRMHADLNAWMGEAWKGRSLWLAPLLSLDVLAPGGGCLSPASISSPALPAAGRVWGCLSSLLALACILIGLFGFPRRRSTGARSGRNAAAQGALGESVIEAAFLLLPLAGLAGASMLWAPAYVLGRSDALAFPALALLVGRGLARLPRWSAWGALVFWAVLSVIVLAPTYGIARPAAAKGNDRHLAHLLADRGLEPSDWLIHTYLTSPSLEYYLRRCEALHQVAWFPPDAEHPPAGARPTPLDSLRTYERQAIALREKLAVALPEDGAVWILALSAGRGSDGDSNSTAPRGVTADELAYPGSLLLFYLAGRTPQEIVARYRQDWVGGDRILVRVPRRAWVPLETLPPVQAAGS
ncbi:MAG: hypothetical protein V1774_08485, partial [Candidatus Eisenbacteria bacterium]